MLVEEDHTQAVPVRNELEAYTHEKAKPVGDEPEAYEASSDEPPFYFCSLGLSKCPSDSSFGQSVSDTLACCSHTSEPSSSPAELSPWGSEKMSILAEQHMCSMYSWSQPTHEGGALMWLS